MITKNRRLAIIAELVNTHSPNSQGKLLKLLHDRGFAITQTTLSRDIKQLKISKIPDERGNYVYMTPHQETNAPNRFFVKDKTIPASHRGFISIEFSNQLGVIKTRTGYASGIASDINHKAPSIILGTIVGDNTILLIPREDISRQEILNSLSTFIPGMKKEEGDASTTS
jgi:transcriptional regulator of arginine metabolism